MPFWGTLLFLLILAGISSLLLYRLHDLGSTLFRVGLAAVTLQTTWLAMSERRHLILLLVFALLVGGVFLAEKIKKVLCLPYYDSRRNWWESYPKGIPGLSVELKVLLESEVKALLRTRDGFGWGLRFSESSLDGDWTKDLQDYLGFLRRSGYDVASTTTT